MVPLELNCRHCGWRTVSNRSDAIGRLRVVGYLRRDTDPDDEVVATLLIESAPQMTCPGCKSRGLAACPASGDDDADGDWQAAILCELCRQPIPPERLEAIPGVRRCVACQGKSESGQLVDDEPDYCEHCGALVELRVSRGVGITRYRRFCTGNPPCRL